MNNALLAIFFIYCLLMAYFGINSNKSIFIKYISFIFSVIFLILLFVINFYLLGKPRPIEIPFFKNDYRNNEILSHALVENVGIYLLISNDKGHPMYYVLDWDEEKAKELQRESEKAQRTNTTLVVKEEGLMDDNYSGGIFGRPVPKVNPQKKMRKNK